MLSVEKLEYFK